MKKFLLESKSLMERVEEVQSEIYGVKALVLGNYSKASLKAKSPSKGRNQTSWVTLGEDIVSEDINLPQQVRTVFSSHMLSLALAQTLCIYIEKIHSCNDSTTVTSRAMSIVMYGLKRNMKREAFKHGVGKRHANFRFWVAKQGLSNAITYGEQ